MSALIGEKKVFERCSRILSGLIDRRCNILGNPLKGKPKPDFWFWADNARTHYFEKYIQSLLQNDKEDSACVYLLKPHPVKYFFNNFGYYPVGQINEPKRAGCYLEIIEEEPSSIYSDSIEANGTYFTVFSMKGSWIFLIDRDLNIGFFFSNYDIYKKKISKFDSFVKINEFYEMYKNDYYDFPEIIRKLEAFINPTNTSIKH